MRIFLTSFLLLSVLVLGGCHGPIGPFAGGKLSGDKSAYPTSWQLAVDVEHVQLETYATDEKVHSVNIWCVVLDDRLFFSTSLVRGEESPGNRQWVRNVATNNTVRLKVNDRIFDGYLRRVENPQLVTGVKNAFGLKYDFEDEKRTRLAWIFELVEKQT